MIINDFKSGTIAYLSKGKYHNEAILFINKQVESVDDMNGVSGKSTSISTSEIISGQWEEIDSETARRIYSRLHPRSEFPIGFDSMHDIEEEDIDQLKLATK